MRRRRAGVVAVALGLALFLGGCAGGSDPGGPADSAPVGAGEAAAPAGPVAETGSDLLANGAP